MRASSRQATEGSKQAASRQAARAAVMRDVPPRGRSCPRGPWWVLVDGRPVLLGVGVLAMRTTNDDETTGGPVPVRVSVCACGPLRLSPRCANETRRRRGGEVKTRARARVSATHERRLSLPCMSETPRPLRPCCVRVPRKRRAEIKARLFLSASLVRRFHARE